MLKTSQAQQPPTSTTSFIGAGFARQAPLIVLIVCVLALTALPYVYGYAASPPNRSFSGVMFDVPDTMQYFSWLRDHRSAWLVSNRMTAEPNAPALFNLLWLVVGRTQAFTGLSVPVLFHGVRVIASVAFLLVLFWLCGLFTRSRAERWLAYLVMVFGAGLGWIWVVEKYLLHTSDLRFPLDVYLIEPNTLFVLLGFPHFAIATALIAGVFGCFLQALRTRRWRFAAVAALLALALTLQHAYDLLIIGLVPAGALALIALRDRRLPWRGALYLALIGLVAAPPAAYFTLLTTRDPLWRRVLAQFANAGVFSPPPYRLFIVMGMPLILVALWGAWSLAALLRRESGQRLKLLVGQSDADLFLWAWFGVGLLLLYAPTDFQIHMFTAWQVPLALLAVRGLYRLATPALARRAPQLARLLPAALLIAVLPTNLYIFAWRFVDLGRHQAPYFLSRGEDDALAWLEQHATHNDVVLSGLNVGQFVAARSDARAFLAHWAQTVDFYAKSEQARQFFAAATSDAERRALLRSYTVTYVLAGNEEHALGAYALEGSPLLDPVFRSDEVVIYRTRSNSQP